MSPTLHQKDPDTRLLAKLSPVLENLQILRQLSFLSFISFFFGWIHGQLPELDPQKDLRNDEHDPSIQHHVELNNH